MTTHFHEIALTKLPGVGAQKAKLLLSYCGSAEAVFQERKKALLKIPQIGEAVASAVVDHDVFGAVEAELEFIQRYGVRVLYFTEPDYPQRLRHFDDSPILLYYKGTADLNAPRTVGIVGTRNATEQGRAFCEQLVEELVPYQPLVVSGLAYGIDVTAHRQSLQSGLPTVGVVANGLDRVYPAAHRKTAQKMTEQGGLLTEYGKGTQPDRDRFPARNRIVAMLSDALVVVESAIRGGSMITANLAADYNKDVFAVPGRPKDTYSAGCNHLIKAHRASLIDSAADLAYVLRWQEQDKGTAPVQRQLFVDLDEQERTFVAHLSHDEPVTADVLCYKAGITPSTLATLALQLEFKGVVKSLPGQRYLLV